MYRKTLFSIHVLSSCIENHLFRYVRDKDDNWVLYILTAVEQTAHASIETVREIKALLLDVKHRIRDTFRFYSQDLINNLFKHPYTKIEFLMRDLGVSRLTATNYLNQLTDEGFLHKQKQGRTNYYINMPLYRILERI